MGQINQYKIRHSSKEPIGDFGWMKDILHTNKIIVHHTGSCMPEEEKVYKFEGMFFYNDDGTELSVGCPLELLKKCLHYNINMCTVCERPHVVWTLYFSKDVIFPPVDVTTDNQYFGIYRNMETNETVSAAKLSSDNIGYINKMYSGSKQWLVKNDECQGLMIPSTKYDGWVYVHFGRWLVVKNKETTLIYEDRDFKEEYA